MYEDDLLAEDQYQNWFPTFRPDDFDTEGVPRTKGRIKVDKDKIKG